MNVSTSPVGAAERWRTSCAPTECKSCPDASRPGRRSLSSQAFGEADDLTRLAQAGFDVEHIEDAQSGPPAMPGPPEVGAGPRRRRGPIPLPAPPSGPGRAPGGYLSVDEIEAASTTRGKIPPRGKRHRPASPDLGGPRAERSASAAATRTYPVCCCLAECMPGSGEPRHLDRLRRTAGFRLARRQRDSDR